MANEPAPNEGGNNSGDTPAAEFQPITTQEDLNRVITDRVARERAKYSDYKDLKSKASRLDEIEQANKSEAQKAADKVAKAEADVAAIPSKVAEALRGHLVELHKIDQDDADLFLTGTEPDLLLKQVTRLLDRSGERKKKGNVAPKEGGDSDNSGHQPDGMREFARNLFGRDD